MVEKSIFPKLDAMQNEKLVSDQDMAKLLHMPQELYIRKKQTGVFTPWEQRMLCQLFHSSFKELFGRK